MEGNEMRLSSSISLNRNNRCPRTDDSSCASIYLTTSEAGYAYQSGYGWSLHHRRMPGTRNLRPAAAIAIAILF
ncbi:hypothetical protein G7K_3074-t1 [Saitoella complicata NRRL Y-17804]|uniref:Uncharacterized protein n=1 Tax=Saitoella complicata (strain BCRC 22490 / CBS 7301 / JCM 7358 / NBRC 10748 / NRRL Y-17804) TaxID=698492 RepID=A0A0E9NGW8_SAICN|nr:hypothetical protein G7K_3074-t1 [Saitoella complicata NRRL Y-17804]